MMKRVVLSVIITVCAVANAGTNDLPSAIGGTVPLPSSGILDLTGVVVRVDDPSGDRDAVNARTLALWCGNAVSTGKNDIIAWCTNTFATSNDLARAVQAIPTTGVYAVSASNVAVSSIPLNYTPAAATVEGHLRGIDSALGSVTSAPVVSVGITNFSAVLTNIFGVTTQANSARVLFNTNIPVPSAWAHYPAETNVDAAGFSVRNVSTITMTGRVVIGFGVFANTNDVPPPASSNVWYVYAAAVNGTNYLMGVDTSSRRTYIGAHP